MRITPKNVRTTLQTRPTLAAAFCKEFKSGKARDRKKAASKYGSAIPRQKRNNVSAPSDADPTVPT
jgi:hypothetical protein